MKPTVTKLSSVPLTALLCCPQCTRLISYERGTQAVACHSCGATITPPPNKPAGSALNQR